MSSGVLGIDTSGPVADLALVVVVTEVLVAVVTLDPLRGSPLAWGLVLPYVLFVPGYAVVSALYPDGAGPLRPADAVPNGPDDPDLSPLGRVVLSLGASVGVVAAVAITLDFTVWGFQRLPLVAGVGLFTFVAAAVAAYRRQRVRNPAGVGRDAFVAGLSKAVGDDTRSRVLSAVAVLCVVSAAGAVAMADPATPGDDLRTASLVAGEDAAADDYQRTLTVGEPTDYTLSLENGAEDALRATVVVQLQTVDVGETVRVTDRTELRRVEVEVPANGRESVTTPVVPASAGERRLTQLVYFGDAPDTATVETADREVHLWVTALEGGEES